MFASKQTVKSAAICVAAAFMLLSLADSAGAVTIAENGPVYNVESVSPFMTYYKRQNENVAMATGALTISATDLHLPGRGGLDLSLTRIYANNRANVYRMRGDDGFYTNYTDSGTHFDNKYAIGVGWAFNFPSIEYPADTGDDTFLHFGGNTYAIDPTGESVSGLKDYYLNNMLYNTTAGVFTYNSVNYSYDTSLEIKDGMRYYFNAQGEIIVIKNRFSDAIIFTYGNFDGKHVITKITDCVGREMNITYTTAKVTVTCGDKTIEYNLEAIAGISGEYKLASVVYKDIGGQDLSVGGHIQ